MYKFKENNKYYIQNVTPKRFILRLEVFPEAKYLRFHSLTLGEVQQVYVPIDEVIPITKYDYWSASWWLWMK